MLKKKYRQNLWLSLIPTSTHLSLQGEFVILAALLKQSEVRGSGLEKSSTPTERGPVLPEYTPLPPNSNTNANSGVNFMKL